MASVTGPRQAPGHKEDAERATLDVVFQPWSGSPGDLEHHYEHTIRRTLESVVNLTLHPRTCITVVLQVVQADGSMLSCAFNAACTALVDAGIPMTQMLASVTVAQLPSRGLILDPDASEEQAASAHFCFVHPFHYHFPSAGVSGDEGQAQDPTLVIGDGLLCGAASAKGEGQGFSADDYFDAMELCSFACRKVAQFARLSLGKSLQTYA
ncbi:MAG: hypothetical protein WDW36_008567 [Sanguina aurantia]